MSGSSLTSALGGSPTADLTPDQTSQLGQMQQTYNSAEEFETAVTQIKLLGDTKLDAIKQRPQV